MAAVAHFPNTLYSDVPSGYLGCIMQKHCNQIDWLKNAKSQVIGN